MSLMKGDHLVIKRNGKIVEGELSHEFEVLHYPSTFQADYSKSANDVHVMVLLKQVK